MNDNTEKLKSHPITDLLRSGVKNIDVNDESEYPKIDSKLVEESKEQINTYMRLIRKDPTDPVKNHL